MASACVNNTSNKFPWLTPNPPPFTNSKTPSFKPNSNTHTPAEVSEISDLENDVADFEFCLHHPLDNDTLPTADELISDGKLMPMTVQHVTKQPVVVDADVSRLPDLVQMKMKTSRVAEVLSSERGGGDPFLFSPKAPRCASRWKEILGFKKMQHNGINNSHTEKSCKSIKNLLNKASFTHLAGGGVNVNLPLLRDLECEYVSMSSRLSLSSSSSGHEIEDFPRLSLDNEKQSINPMLLLKNNLNPPPRLRLVKSRENGGVRPARRSMSTDQSQCNASLGIGVDSPRMNSSGKIVFQSLERSSSSPLSFNGGARLKHGGGGMERSYSASVRASTVLNVPVCSLSKSGSVFGFGQLFSSHQKRDLNGRSYQCISNNSSSSSSGRNRTDRA